MKVEPAPGGALDGGVAAHQPGDLPGNRQAQAGAAELPGRRGVGLGERLEELGRLLGRHADARVGDGKADPLAPGLGLGLTDHREPHGALFGELAGVAQQVQQALAEPRDVVEETIGSALADDLHGVAVLGGERLGGQPHLLDQVGRGDEFGHQVHPPGLDLGNVQDVINQRQQVFARLVDLGEVGQCVGLALGLGELLEQLAVADDGVQRGAQLVAHVGQEGALDAVGLDGLLVRLAELVVDPADGVLGALALADLGEQALVGAPELGGPLRDEDLELVVHPPQRFLGVLALGDVEGDPLEEDGPTLRVADDLCLAVDPDDLAVTREEAVLGAEVLAGRAGHRELGVPAVLVVGVELAIPEDGVFQPLLLGEPEHGLDLRRDVKLVGPFVERGHEGDGRELLDERPVSRLGLELLGLGAEVLGGSGRGRGGRAVPGRRGHGQARRIGERQGAEHGLGLLKAQGRLGGLGVALEGHVGGGGLGRGDDLALAGGRRFRLRLRLARGAHTGRPSGQARGARFGLKHFLQFIPGKSR